MESAQLRCLSTRWEAEKVRNIFQVFVSNGISWNTMKPILKHGSYLLLHFVAFFHVASLLSTGVDNEKDFLEYTLKCSQLISSSDNKKILFTTRNARLDSGRYPIKYYFCLQQCWTVATISSYGHSQLFGPLKLRPLVVDCSISRRSPQGHHWWATR